MGNDGKVNMWRNIVGKVNIVVLYIFLYHLYRKIEYKLCVLNVAYNMNTNIYY